MSVLNCSLLQGLSKLHSVTAFTPNLASAWEQGRCVSTHSNIQKLWKKWASWLCVFPQWLSLSIEDSFRDSTSSLTQEHVQWRLIHLSIKRVCPQKRGKNQWPALTDPLMPCAKRALWLYRGCSPDKHGSICRGKVRSMKQKLQGCTTGDCCAIFNISGCRIICHSEQNSSRCAAAREWNSLSCVARWVCSILRLKAQSKAAFVLQAGIRTQT